MTYAFPGEASPPDLTYWHGGPRPRRYGGGIWWGGPGWPSAEHQQVAYANPCPPGAWYSHEAERCLPVLDPFAGRAGGYAMGHVPEGGSEIDPFAVHDLAQVERPVTRPYSVVSAPSTPAGWVVPEHAVGKALAVVAVAAPALGLLPWSWALAGYLATRLVEPLR